MGPEFNPQFQAFYKVFMTQLQLVVPPTVNIPEAYERGNDEQQKFVQNLALFFTGFLKAHIGVLEQTPEDQVGQTKSWKDKTKVAFCLKLPRWLACRSYSLSLHILGW